MSWLMASDVAERLGAKLVGEDVALNSVITDTRKPDSKALFIALIGPNFDAHEALEKAADKSVAAALLVSRKINHPATQIIVENTHDALGKLAASWRESYAGLVVGLTGSNGKTTVKEMLASVFSEAGSVHATKGNFNNDIGMPLTLLSLRSEDDVAVIEMGANHHNEIAYLTNIARPNIALVNNAAAAHLEGFGSIEGVANAKAEIFSGLKNDGVAIINLDDKYSAVWQKAAVGKRQVSFGVSELANVRLISTQPLNIQVADENIAIELPLLGKHNAMNATAATAVAVAAGIKTQDIAEGLKKMTPVVGRLFSRAGKNNSRIIDDAYNANPGSIHAAIDTLAALEGKHILVLGEMGEMGDSTEQIHAELGEYAKAAGIETFLSVGSMMSHAVAAFGEGALFFSSQDELVNALEPMLDGETIVLVKGSHYMQMDKVVARVSLESSEKQQGSQHAA